MSTLTIIPAPSPPTLESCLTTALAVCRSTRTRYRYAKAIRRFLDSGQPLTRAGVLTWISGEPANSGRAPKMSAILLLAHEANMQDVIDDRELKAIDDIPRPKQQKYKTGNWLSTAECKQLMSLPPASYKGYRDAALLAVMLGCGLRAGEVLELNWTQYQLRGGRPCFVNLHGKGDQTRTVPIPKWVDKRLKIWKYYQPGGVEIPEGRYLLFELQYIGLQYIIGKYSKRLGRKFNAHDLRRTIARLMHAAGVKMDQIQLTLGHSNQKTTELYLGSKLELGSGKAGLDLIDFDEMETTDDEPKL